jgi:enoyl-CoA hydratase
MPVSTESLVVSVLAGVLRIQFDAPDGLNRLTFANLERLGAIFERGLGDARVVLLIGTRGKGFTVGGDLRELQQLTPEGAQQLATSGAQVFDRILTCRLPVVAALNGDALGAGFLLALAADVRIAATNARLGYPEIRVGLMPGTGGTDLLVRLAGLAVARSLCLTGTPVSAQRAQELGLVDAVCDGEGLEAEAAAWCRRLGELSPVAFAETKAALHAAATMTFDESRRRETLAFRRCFESPEYHQRIGRFLRPTEGS